MSVLACQRPRCDEVMCDHLVLGGYLCHGCLDELLRLKEGWPEQLTEADLDERLRTFLDSPKVAGPSTVDRDKQLKEWISGPGWGD